jgi:DNA-binding transcriptional LysR family regulator
MRNGPGHSRRDRASGTAQIRRNLRHLRLFLAAAETGSLSEAARRCNVTQSATSQAIGKIERAAGGLLFQRSARGLVPTDRGTLVTARIRRALALLDPALSAVSERLVLTATEAQLTALTALCETGNHTLAARRLGLAQPTVHRAAAHLEREADLPLFDRHPVGLTALRPALALARAFELAMRELDQAEEELAEMDGGEAGRLLIGALPMSRSVLLPRALIAFRARRPRHEVLVLDGPYDDLLNRLRRGEIDLMVGALREPAPIPDIEQTPLFEDGLSILAGPDHPLAGRASLTRADLAASAWVVPRSGTPSRDQFDAFFAGCAGPGPVIETGSILLMREILVASDHLGCISRAQARPEVRRGLLVELPVKISPVPRPIGLTCRTGWKPTRAQDEFLDLLRAEAAGADFAESLPR